MKLSPKQKKLVKEYIQKLQTKKSLKEYQAPIATTLNDLNNYQAGIQQKIEELRDEFVSFLIELDGSLGTHDPLYSRVEKLVDRIEVIEKVLPSIFKEYKSKLGL